jgi:hypothetical protein
MTGELTEVGILNGDVVAFVIRLIALDMLMKGRSSLNRQEIWVLGQGNLFMGANEYLDIAHSYPC